MKIGNCAMATRAESSATKPATIDSQENTKGRKREGPWRQISERKRVSAAAERDLSASGDASAVLLCGLSVHF